MTRHILDRSRQKLLRVRPRLRRRHVEVLLRGEAGFLANRRNYRAMWRRVVRSGRDGQALDDPSTWRRDANLYSAACFQCCAAQTEMILAGALDVGAHPSFIAAFVRCLEDDWQRAHDAFAGKIAFEEAR